MTTIAPAAPAPPTLPPATPANPVTSTNAPTSEPGARPTAAGQHPFAKLLNQSRSAHAGDAKHGATARSTAHATTPETTSATPAKDEKVAATDDDDARADPALADWLAHLAAPDTAAPTPPAGAGGATAPPELPGQATAATAATPATPSLPAIPVAPPATPAVAAADNGAGERATSPRDTRRDEAERSVAIDTPAAGTTFPDKNAADAATRAEASAPQLRAAADTPSTVQWAAVSSATLPAPRAAAAGAPPTPLSLPTPVGTPEFVRDMGVQLSVLAKNGVERAELHLNPADMGPVSVQIVMDGTQARVEFGADVAATRQAIETGLPELASALREAGLTLTGGGVSQHSSGREPGRDQAGGGATRASRGETVAGERVAPLRRQVVAGGVDLYA